MTFEDRPLSKLGSLVLRLLSTVGLTKLTFQPQDGSITAASNLTILNVFLVRFGPMSEKRLVQTLTAVQASILTSPRDLMLTCFTFVIECFRPTRFPWQHSYANQNVLSVSFFELQVVCSVLAFVVRYGMAWLVYDGDRR